MPPSPVTLGFAAAPIGECLISPPMLTSCLEAAFCAFALFNSAIQDGWPDAGGVGLGLGLSGLLRAVSSQLAFVGLQRRGSIVLEGLVGGYSSSSSFMEVSIGGRVALASFALGVASVLARSSLLLWLEVGLEPSTDASDLSLNMLVGRDLERECMLFRFEATESARASPGGEVTLHRFTLSDRFIMALWTKPPIPLVGEMGLVGDERPEPSTEPRRPSGASSSGAFSVGGSSLGVEDMGGGEARRRSADFSGSMALGASLASVGAGRSIPGSAVFTEDMSRVSESSTWFLRYAAEPRPLSAVCLNHEGSFEPSAWAI